MSGTKQELSPRPGGKLDLILENADSTRSDLSMPSFFSNHQDEAGLPSQRDISTRITIEDIQKQQKRVDDLGRELCAERMKLKQMKQEFTEDFQESFSHSQTSLSTTDTAINDVKDSRTRTVEVVTPPKAKHVNRPGALFKRESNFKVEDKIKPLMKGASTLSLDEIKKYDVQRLSDPIASPSAKVQKSQLGEIESDGEVWVEKLYWTKDGRKRTVFVSQTTGEKSLDEPPTGASKVIFLKESNY